jgi:hypothetical protein
MWIAGLSFRFGGMHSLIHDALAAELAGDRIRAARRHRRPLIRRRHILSLPR